MKIKNLIICYAACLLTSFAFGNLQAQLSASRNMAISKNDSASIKIGNNGAIEFRTASAKTTAVNVTLTERMRIAPNGNVGIGTTNPSAKLEVAGDILAREIIVDIDAGADFVFEPDYHLRPLTEVEQFITENKRLPDIAPADSMVQKGINMGELQIQLLQKIEELTLYMIELEKENQKQSLMIEDLKKEIDKIKNDE